MTTEADFSTASAREHEHVFLGPGHDANERRTWLVIGLCTVMMGVEIGGGVMFGSLALVADGLHMSTHAGALLLAALAYSFARKHANDPRFTFGTGKLGDLAGFTSAVVLALIALLIGYEAVQRLFAPTAIQFREAIPIAVVGLGVNVLSAWLLGGGHHGHSHGHGHGHDHDHDDHDHDDHDHDDHDHDDHNHDHHDHDDHDHDHPVAEAHGHAHAHAHAAQRDNNMRAAVVHVMADAAVSVLVILGLTLAKLFGWLWMDPLAGIIGAVVIAGWSYGLIRDTGAILLDMNPDPNITRKLRLCVEAGGDAVADLHLWRLGPGHLGAIVCVETEQARGPDYYHDALRRVGGLSHLTVEVRRPTA